MKYLDYLKELKTVLRSDDKAIEAISLLEDKIRSLESLSSKETNANDLKDSDRNRESLGEGSFPLPKSAEDTSAYFCFSDGACRGNPGPGGWGYMVQASSGEVLSEDNGYDSHTTNNRMELKAAIEALRYVEKKTSVNSQTSETLVLLYSDSKYVLDGLKSWVAGWKARGWKKADKKTPENVELWKELDELRNGFLNLETHWVKGHSGHPQNERCDELANLAIDLSQ